MGFRLRIVSDLHFEFMRDNGAAMIAEITAGDDYDALVIAGDLSSAKGLRRALARVIASSKAPVVFVAGNHEFYGGAMLAGGRHPLHSEVVNGPESAELTGLNWLDNEVAALTLRVRILGTTLWFPYDGPTPYDGNLADFSAIRGFRDHVGDAASSARQFLEASVREGAVVVTHHLPHPACISPQYAGSTLNRYFLHDVSSVVERAGAALWVHGHTHSSFDFVVGKTRVVCNPLGYVGTMMRGEPNPDFDPRFTVEV